MSQQILLLVEKCSHCLSYYDIDSGQRLNSIALPDFPHEFVTDNENRYAYVGHYGVETSGHPGDGGSDILQIDLAAATLCRTIRLAPFNRIHGMQMDERGRLYALSEAQATLLTLEHPAEDTAPTRAVTTGGIKAHLFALTRDGQWAYAMNLLSHTVTKIKPHDATFTPVACSPGDKPEGYALNADESILYVTNRWSNTLSAIDTETMQVIRTARSRTDATRLYRWRDGRLVVTNYGERSLSVVDPHTLEELAHVPMEARAIALSFHPQKPIAFVSQDNDKLGYFNMESLQFERFIATQREPDVSKIATIDWNRK